jgi:hypothetical protein
MIIIPWFRKLLPLIAINIFLIPCQETDAQSTQAPAIVKKDLPDTILGRRTLLLPVVFDGQQALHKLFPGRFYDLSSIDGYNNKFISWECKTCHPVIYPDVNGVEDPVAFPYKDGVATRLINILDYSDSGGRQYKLLSFNHSVYADDGIQTGRFSGGLLGVAKFNRTDSGWRLQAFQPAISAYGAFEQAPSPKLLMIGDNQFALMVEHANGGGGGPFTQDDYLIAGAGGSYHQILSAYGVGRTQSEEEQCTWTSTYTVSPVGKKYFRDIVITCKGQYWATDSDGLPSELKDKVHGKEKGNFTITHVYVYSGKQGYQEQLPATVKIGK